MACKYTLNFKGRTQNFATEDELYNYLKENLEFFKGINVFGDIVFDELNSRQIALVNQIKSVVSIPGSRNNNTEYNDYTQELEVTSPRSLSVTKAITTWRYNGKRLVDEFIPENYIKNKTDQLIEEGKSREEAEKIAKENLSNFKHLANIGSKVHKVAEMFFSSNINPDDIYGVVDLPRETIDNLLTHFRNLKEQISAGKNVEFLPELTFETIDSESEPIIGRIDLLTVDEEGNIGIYDFKVSTKGINDWISTKTTSVDLQLAIYRALLANKGIPVNKVSLNVIPIVLQSPDYENETFNSFRFEDPENRLVANYDNLNLRTGRYTKIVSEHIAYKLPEVSIKSDFLDNVDVLSEVAFGKITGVTLDEFVKRYVKKDKNTGEYYFFDYIHKKGKSNKEFERISASSKEEIREKAKKYLVEKDIYDQEEFYSNLYDQIKTIKDSSKLTAQSRLFENKEPNVHSYLITVFEEYLDNPNYQILEIPELAQMGIYAFQEKGSGIVNFITLTNIDLNHELKLKFNYDSILANVLSTSQSKNYRDMMNNTVKSAKILQTLLAVNALPDIFQNYKIGNIMVVNHKLGQASYADVTQVTNNFKYLTRALDITNNFDNGILCYADPLEVVKIAMIQIIGKYRTEDSTGNYSTSIYDLYADKDLNNMTGEHKIKMLRELQELLKKAKSSINFNSPNANLSDPAIRLYAQLSQLILHYNNIYFNIDHDIYAFRININPKRTIGFEGYYFDNPEMSENPIMRYIVQLTELGLQKMRIKYHDYKQDQLQRVLKFYKDKGLSKIERFTIKDATIAFDNMWIRDSSGHIDKSFRVKNPYDPNSTLSSAEREYLKVCLWNINKMRNGFTPEQRKLTHKQAIDLEQVQSLISAGTYFDMPLIQGTMLTQIRNGSYRDWLSNQWRQAADIRNILESQKEDINLQIQDYTKMYNFLDISLERRAELLNEKDTSYWETNLEFIEDVFIHAATRKEIFDDLLPFIKDARLALELYAFDGNVDIPYLKDQIDRYIRTVIFNEPGPKDTSALKAVNLATGIARSTMLGFNFNSLFREPIQGFYSLMSRSMTRVLGKNAFTTKDLVKAYNRFFFDLGGPLSDNWTLLEHLNIYYGMTQMDVNGMAYMCSSNRKGIKSGSKLPYWATTAPDFLNRMVFLTAQMYHDGCMNAHDIINGKLVYDWTKDERYTEFRKGNKSHPKYNEQKTAYYARLQQFNREGYDIKYNPDKPEVLPAAYTIAEKESIKSGADSLFGYMDHENAMPLRNMLFGKLLTQFKNYWTSTRERWVSGGKYSTTKGEWVQRTNSKGQLLYYKEVVDPNTGEVTMEETTEVTPIKAEVWTGRFVEGMVNSVWYYSQYLIKRGWNDPDYVGKELMEYRKANTKQFFTDIIWRMLMLYLFKMFVENLKEQGKDITGNSVRLLRQAMVRSSDELVPFAAISPLVNVNVPAFEGITNMVEGLGKVVTGDKSVNTFLNQNWAAYRTGLMLKNAISDDDEN